MSSKADNTESFHKAIELAQVELSKAKLTPGTNKAANSEVSQGETACESQQPSESQDLNESKQQRSSAVKAIEKLSSGKKSLTAKQKQIQQWNAMTADERAAQSERIQQAVNDLIGIIFLSLTLS